MSIREQFVENPGSEEIALQLTKKKAVLCIHHKAVCCLCGVRKGRFGRFRNTWSAISYEERLKLLKQEEAREKRLRIEEEKRLSCCRKDLRKKYRERGNGSGS